MGLVADLWPVRIAWPDGHLEPRRGRAFILDDRLILHLSLSEEPIIRPIVGGVTHNRDRWSVSTAEGMIELLKVGCGGCSPLRRLTPPSG